MRAVEASLLQVLEDYGFEPNEAMDRWVFEGHESRATRIVLELWEEDGCMRYTLCIQDFSGGEGYEDEEVYARLEDLLGSMRWWCEAASRPYVKSWLQRRFEPLLGHDMAYALFHRRK